MTRRLQDVRIIPVALFAAASLFVLKTAGLLFDGQYVLTGPQAASAQSAPPAQPAEVQPAVPASDLMRTRADGSRPSWAQRLFNYPDHTGSVGGAKPAEPPKPAAQSKDAKDKAEPPKPAAQSKDAKDKAEPAAAAADRPNPAPLSVTIDPSKPLMSAGERALLERLQERRLELESRARALDVRENLIKAAEKRLESRVGELKALESRVSGSMQKRDEAEAAKFKSLVVMYENMKAKEAAKIFDRLDIKILVDVANQMNPRRMSDIMAQMTPEAAERLTVELAQRAGGAEKPQASAELPKIQGRPSSN
jgi:flagellar motility protein MotE (MotC chaperone)